jgi:hypothetical protein
MSSQINPNAIDATYPISGVNQSSEGFRRNFLAIQNAEKETVNEINDLINKVIVSAPLTYGANANVNNMAGMPISNVKLLYFGCGISDHGQITSCGSENFDFAEGQHHILDIEGSNIHVFFNPVNFPNNGYSELVIDVTTATPPQYINFDNLSSFGNIYGGANITGFNSNSNIFTIVDTNPVQLTVGSYDGLNWTISAMQGQAASPMYTPASNIGKIGDTKGSITFDDNNLYICVANYTGNTAIWKKVMLSSF